MPSFGEALRRERELREISLREISEATKVNLRYLEALERNDFRHLPGGVFNKGFVRAYAQHIGIDAESMVTAYLEEERNQEQRSEERRSEREQRMAPSSVIAPARGRARAPGRRVLGWLAALFILAAVAAGAAYVWLHMGRAAAGRSAEAPSPATQPDAESVDPGMEPAP